MSKFFIGVPAIVPDYIKQKADKYIQEDQPNPHITLMYCGKEVTTDQVKVITELFAKEFEKLSPNAFTYKFLGNYELFGLNKDVLVAKIEMPEDFVDAVNEARRAVYTAVPSLPPSDFEFSAHITLGFGAQTTPSRFNSSSDNIFFDEICGYGDEYVKRSSIKRELKVELY